MDSEDVRIVTLPAMRVVSAYGYGPSPELEAQEKLMAWVEENHLLAVEPKPRFFGFNNPSPHPGSPNYGYEMWITVGPDVQPGVGMKVVGFPGGQFAVLRVRGGENIYAAWQNLLAWLENSPYSMGSIECLEEHLVFWQAPLEDLTLDLYLSVSPSGG
jgi:DNA gyrase inhibitor GyrI